MEKHADAPANLDNDAPDDRPERLAPTLIRPLAWVWMGIVIGVSFLATPVKFTADSLSRPVALDVGRATFHALGYVEWTLLAILAVAVWRTSASGHRLQPRAQLTVAVIALTVVLQAVWLVPALDDRVASIIAGVEPPPSHLHTTYGIAEVAKVAALGLLGAWAPIATPAANARRTTPEATSSHTTA